MVSAFGNWDWFRLAPLLPPEVLEQIAAVQPPQVWLDSDTPGWRWTDTRQFTTNSTYSFLTIMNSTTTDSIWRRVWALPILQRVKTFLWITLHNRNLTNVERFRRHLTFSAFCNICRSNMEDMDHILRHCVAARGLDRGIYSSCESSFSSDCRTESSAARITDVSAVSDESEVSLAPSLPDAVAVAGPVSVAAAPTNNKKDGKSTSWTDWTKKKISGVETSIENLFSSSSSKGPASAPTSAPAATTATATPAATTTATTTTTPAATTKKP
ncbi:hypothetical protein GQ457_16G029280 [Hibiscus cannabinus]